MNFESVQNAYLQTLSALLNENVRFVPLRTDGSANKADCWEILNYGFTVSAPRDRLTTVPGSQFRLPLAAARFVWMMGANDRLADIEFYSKGARNFSDDGIIVPGSSYGHRILNPSPGINQLAGIISCLREERHSKRAAVSVYQAEDAIRSDSRDIPCTFGFGFHVREEKLVATILMRSNNAYLLLPFNLFEFSLLAELVASELDVEIGSLYYHALSMHLISGDQEKAQQVLAESVRPTSHMPPMPPRSMSQVTELVKLEAKMRHSAAGMTDDGLEEWIRSAEGTLDVYWQQVFFLLLLHVARERKLRGALSVLRGSISEPFASALGEPAFFVEGEPEAVEDGLFGDTSAIRIDSGYLAMLAELEAIMAHESRKLSEEGNAPLTFEEQQKIRNELIGSPRSPVIASRDLPSVLEQARQRIRSLRQRSR